MTDLEPAAVPTWPQLVIPPQPISNPPVGAILDWPTPVPPPMWLFANGQSVPTATYPDLFTVIGYTFGGSGANFNLPDLRDRVTLGAGPVHALGSVGGAATVALTAAQNGAHQHNYTGGSTNALQAHTHPPGTLGTGWGDSDHTHTASGTTANDSPDHNHGLGFAWAATAGIAAGATNDYKITPGNNLSFGAGQRHAHTYSGGTTAQGAQHGHPVTVGATGGDNGAHTHTVSGTTDAAGSTGAAHENMPPFVTLFKIIRVEKD